MAAALAFDWQERNARRAARPMIDPDRVLELLNPPTFTVAEARDVIGRILRREDTGALVEACSDLYLRLSGEGPNRPDLIWLCCDALRAGPLVRGAMLREGWIDGRHCGKLARAGYSKTKILAWFRAASPETLMCD